ncbi:MAG: 2,3,4,5-tetrahydropyridine-2,6-dicarboxylate N-succinyltransferase [Pseudobdellovibrionaceae bacterium]|jgi:2,3,4,5-tetrahydropyridine-2-carboxylate N-succinyltransferase|nr:2,3,4,5-tetrahydropyridine-2,6-dicarboxylate N-succinyltransferase [Pseudobdellovibrionaceae bacterium]
MTELQTIINAAWDDRSNINTQTLGDVREAVDSALAGLDCGILRIADKSSGQWVVNDWLKKAVLLSFRLSPNRMMDAGESVRWWDKVPLKTADWEVGDFVEGAFRAVPGSIVRKGAYVAPNVVLMPSFINIGAYVDEGTMVDTWSTIGSCAQIGKNCHISGGVGIGGVLEPLQANPVIIEDNVFIGARSEVAEGVIVEEGAVLSMGVFLGASTKIIDRESGEIFKGRVPAYSVVVPGTLPGEKAHLACAVIVKRVDAQTRSKTSINELLRD